MNGPDFLKALMDARGDNAYAIATALRKPALQSYIWKFLNGRAKEPRRSSLQPLADRYAVPVDAFYDAELANRIAVERGLAGGVAREHSQPRPELLSALAVVAGALEKADKYARLSVVPLFAEMAQEPSHAGNISQRIYLLLHDNRTESAKPEDPPSRRRVVGLATSKSMGREARDGQGGADGKQGNRK